MAHKAICGQRFVNALVQAGIVPEDCTRVLIDAKANDVVRIYYDLIGDDRLIELVERGDLKVMIREA